ncbi:MULTISPECIES: amidohydrolase [unclassified Arthrobacter]|uniref:amidohydrolase n=1 Tax=unclassified Arthrobacter TaxID=235627 RepID=UPI001E4F4707|nr:MULTISPECIES: amidohydrolase [unclassified Arthrobacter]MCC9145441.1 amidohydrolase [Arthrobacter sp. zg-Y919]MDK1276669.1 amidohydrolase [Arthrobacter sp. zg.Y919]WIB04383.1 amidohydrolase [Arthrobacter sp. zg-Y919]
MNGSPLPSARTLTLYRNGSVYSAGDPFATAMLVDGDTIAWVGSEQAATSIQDSRMDVVDLRGALVAPGFVDSHVHTTELGMSLSTLDLSGCTSLADLLDKVAHHAAGTTGLILGSNWDESRWPERRAPTAAELDAASGNRAVYLSRSDVHCAAVSGSLAAELGLQDYDGWDDGFVVRAAHDAARTVARDAGLDQRGVFQLAALKHAASRGVVAVTEMAAPHIAPPEDLRRLLGLDGALSGDPLPQILPYWGQLVETEAEVAGLVEYFEGRLLGLAGDLNIDGSLGARTAALREPYADRSDSCGTMYLTPEQVGRHLELMTKAGLQGGFHVIGDAGMDTAVAGLRLAADAVGEAAVRAAHHRLEHAELTDDAAIAELLRFGVTVSLQPGFDAAWGHPGGLYEQRLGDRSRSMNRMASLLSAGVPVALGSDTPVLPLDPWSGVRAAVSHSNPKERVSARAAFIGHTRAGWRAAGESNFMRGQLAAGAPASFALWEVQELMVQTPDANVSAWSTDPRAGTPLLPALDNGDEPRCLQTVHNGRELYRAADLA